MTERLITCPSCGTTNRLPPTQPGRKAVCGKCKTPLPATRRPRRRHRRHVLGRGRAAARRRCCSTCGPTGAVRATCWRRRSISSRRRWPGRVKVAKLNIDENPGIANRFGVRSIPTLLVLKGGKEVDRLVGVQPKQEIVRRLENVLEDLSRLAPSYYLLRILRPLFDERLLRSIRCGVRTRVFGGFGFVLGGRPDGLAFDVNLIQRVQRNHQRIRVFRIPLENGTIVGYACSCRPRWDCAMARFRLMSSFCGWRSSACRSGSRASAGCPSRSHASASTSCSAGSVQLRRAGALPRRHGFLVPPRRGIARAEEERRDRRIGRIAQRDAELIRGRIQIAFHEQLDAAKQRAGRSDRRLRAPSSPCPRSCRLRARAVAAFAAG